MFFDTLYAAEVVNAEIIVKTAQKVIYIHEPNPVKVVDLSSLLDSRVCKIRMKRVINITFTLCIMCFFTNWFAHRSDL